MNEIEAFASSVPYMAAVGNHECGGTNRKHFSRRFAGLNYAAKSSNATPAGSFKSGDNLWYDVGRQKSRSRKGGGGVVVVG
jgi:hypothetical protein